MALRRGAQPERAAAARILAHKQAELEGRVDSEVLVPAAASAEFHLVSHALGYLLGDAMSRELRAGRLGKAELRSMFADRLKHPRALYLRWAQRFTAG